MTFERLGFAAGAEGFPLFAAVLVVDSRRGEDLHFVLFEETDVRVLSHADRSRRRQHGAHGDAQEEDEEGPVHFDY